MTNKKQLITALTLATILIAGGFSMAPQAFSTGSGGNSDHGDDKKDKKGGEDSNKFKDWKKENDHHDDDDDEHDKVKVCHVPPGNEGNAHTIEVSQTAATEHINQHDGDTLGPCDGDEDDGEDDLANIIFIRAVTKDNGLDYSLDDFTISIGIDENNLEEKNLAEPIPIEPNTENFIIGTFPTGFSFVMISGDPACPVHIDPVDTDTFTLKKKQTIVCTIYYDDDFAAGPAPTITLKVDVIDTSLGVNPTFAVDGDSVALDVEIPLTADKTTEITQIDDGDGDSETDVLPSRITGDGHCPEVLAGTITLSTGQKITCTLEYGKEIEPGVVFWHNNLQWTPFPEEVDEDGNPIHSTSGDDEDCSVVDQDLPCAKEVGGVFKIADPMLPSTGKTLILFNLLGAEALGCEVDGIGPSDRTSNGNTVYEFTVNCSNFAGNPVWNWNYAFIETE